MQICRVDADGSAPATSLTPELCDNQNFAVVGGFVYGTFRADFHHFDRIELDLRGNPHVRGAAGSGLRLKLANMVLI